MGHTSHILNIALYAFQVVQISANLIPTLWLNLRMMLTPKLPGFNIQIQVQLGWRCQSGRTASLAVYHLRDSSLAISANTWTGGMEGKLASRARVEGSAAPTMLLIAPVAVLEQYPAQAVQVVCNAPSEHLPTRPEWMFALIARPARSMRPMEAQIARDVRLVRGQIQTRPPNVTFAIWRT